MKKYIVFLRGININGKNKISMPELKEELNKAGFLDVSTYLNSGNIVLVSDDNNIRLTIENIIKNKFNLDIQAYVIEADALKDILSHAPEWWNSSDKSKYDNLIFILSKDSPQDICGMIGEPSESLEQIQVYDRIIFWTFDRKQYQKCNWWKKTASSGIAEKLTIRTAGTVFKACR